MYDIEETGYGYCITLEGFLQRDEAAALLAEMTRRVRPREGGFALLIDLRASRAIPAEAQEVLKQVLLLCKEAGMERTAMVLNSAIATLQARRLARETGIDEHIRYIDSSAESDWEAVAHSWLDQAVEPAVK
ncbi:MAG TPA: hypothetical protein VEG34_00920 [Thermoanaerobaculia bacterium]|nr:hypothetical protein [Thermoanaerobaculia bacterium]